MDPSILDNANKIQQIDKNNMLSFLENIVSHYKKAEKNSRKLLLNYTKPDNIIITGMGGSAIGGELLKDWAKNKIDIPIEINRDYSLPSYANRKSLVMVLSYSGETEESLSSYLDALKKDCMLCCISSGGNLINYAKKAMIPHLIVPSGMPPRAALPYMLTPLLISLEKSNLFHVSEELDEAIETLDQISNENSYKIPIRENFSKKLALKISYSVPVIYGFGIYNSVARRFKQQFNENSKIPSRWDVFSELNHNEIVGWEQIEKFSKNYSAIFLRDKNEPLQIKSRIELTKSLLSIPSRTLEVWSKGESDLSKMLSILCIGDFASVYHAIMNKIDPTPVNTITQLKEKIKKYKIKEKILKELDTLSNLGCN
jgi:glucose/mannose-6-phosphate isomerase